MSSLAKKLFFPSAILIATGFVSGYFVMTQEEKKFLLLNFKLNLCVKFSKIIGLSKLSESINKTNSETNMWHYVDMNKTFFPDEIKTILSWTDSTTGEFKDNEVISNFSKANEFYSKIRNKVLGTSSGSS